MTKRTLQRALWTLALLTSGPLYAQPLVTVTASDGTAAEAGSTGEFTFVLSEAAGGQGLQVEYGIAGSASAGEDYGALPGVVEFAPGGTQQRVRVVPMADEAVEEPEEVTVLLRAGAGYTVGDPDSASVVILDRDFDAPVLASISVVDGVATEGDEDTARLQINLDRPAPDAGLVVRFSVGGTASGEADNDYLPLGDAVEFAPGQDSAELVVTAVDDARAEGTETVRLQLIAGAGYSVATAGGAAQVQIVDNDSPGAGAPGEGGARAVTTLGGNSQRTAAPGDSVRLRVVAQDESGVPAAAVAVQWSLNEAGTAAGGSLADVDGFTNADGEAFATLVTGAAPASYLVTAQADGGGESIRARLTVLAGLVDAAALSTPEGSIAMAMDTFCPQLAAVDGASLTAGEQDLLARCNDLLTALDNGVDSSVQDALRQVAPEEVAAQRRMGVSGARRQTGMIDQRLSRLRMGANGVDLSGLQVRAGGGALNGALLGAFARDLASGGGASADDAVWQDQRLGVFASGAVGSGDKETTAQEAGYDVDSSYAALGADYRIDDRWLAGAAVGYASSELDISDNGGTVDADGYSLSLYGTYAVSDALYLEGVVSYSANDYDTLRRMDYTVDNTRTVRSARGTTEGATVTWTGGAGYETVLAGGVSLELFGRFHYLDSTIDAYNETGANGLNLAMVEQDFDGWQLNAGVQVFKAISRRWGVLVPQVRLAWERDSSDAHVIRGTFVNDRFNTGFDFSTDNPDENYFRAAAGVSAVLASGVSTYVEYESVVGREHVDEHELAFGARWALAW